MRKLNFEKLQVIFILPVLAVMALTVRYLWWRVTSTYFLGDGIMETAGVNLQWALILIAEMALSLFGLIFQIHLILGWIAIILFQKKRIKDSSSKVLIVSAYCYNESEEIRIAFVKAFLVAVKLAKDLGWNISLVISDDGFFTEADLKQKTMSTLATMAGKDNVVNHKSGELKAEYIINGVKIFYFSRSVEGAKNQHAKAGSMNAVYEFFKNQFDWLGIFDIDHLFLKNGLIEVIKQLSINWAAGLVQFPQYFHNVDYRGFDWLDNQTAFWDVIIQPCRSALGGSMSVGTGAFYSCKALSEMKEIHSTAFATYTITEDMATSIRLWVLGFKPVWVSTPISMGEALTVSLSDRYKQLFRWTEGTFEVMQSREWISLRHPLAMLCTLQSFTSYLAFIPSALMMVTIPVYFWGGGWLLPFSSTDSNEFIANWAPQFILNEFTMLAMITFSAKGNWRSWLIGKVWSFSRLQLTGLALLSVLSGKPAEFVVTSKGEEDFSYLTWREICKFNQFNISYIVVGFAGIFIHLLRWGWSTPLVVSVLWFSLIAGSMAIYLSFFLGDCFGLLKRQERKKKNQKNPDVARPQG